jgi:cytochrome c peroxidase
MLRNSAAFCISCVLVSLAIVSLGCTPGDKEAVVEEKVKLGWHLYYDKRLSKDGTVACVSCHAPEHGWSDGKQLMVGIGGQVGGRNSPTILNRVFSDLQFWDGRAKSLEEQALGPIQADKEMGNTLENLVATLSKIEGYKPLFKAAFGEETVTPERVGQAIATFERTVVSGNSPFDRYEQGDTNAMNASAIRGHKIFLDNNRGRCSICHAGFNFTDEKYHNIGVGTEKPGWAEPIRRPRYAT